MTSTTATKYTCSICDDDKEFESKSRLNEHKLRAHAAARFFCNICGHGYTRRYVCLRHIRVQHPKLSAASCFTPGTDEKCPWCSIPFLRGSDATKRVKHVSECRRNHAKMSPTTAKKYTCSICGNDKEFESKSHLNEHKLRAHAAARFFCAICGHGYTRRYLCLRHVHVQHPKLSTAACFTPRTDEKCPWCSVSFSRGSDVTKCVKHVAECRRNPTSKRRPLVELTCENCGSRFYKKSNLLLHRRRKHTAAAAATAEDVSEETTATTAATWESIIITENDIGAFLDGELDPIGLYETVDETENHNFKFDVRERETVFIFSDYSKKLASMGYQFEVIQMVLEALVVKTGEMAMPRSLIYISLDNPTVMDYPAHQRFSNASTGGGFSVLSLLDEVASILQSKDTLVFEGTLTVQIKIINAETTGSGLSRYVRFRSKQIKSIAEYLSMKHGLVDFSPFVRRNHQEFEHACFAICLAAAIETARNRPVNDLRIKSTKWFKTKKLPPTILRRIDGLYAETGLELYTPIAESDFPIFGETVYECYGYRLTVSEAVAPSSRGFQKIFPTDSASSSSVTAE